MEAEAKLISEQNHSNRLRDGLVEVCRTHGIHHEALQSTDHRPLPRESFNLSGEVSSETRQGNGDPMGEDHAK